VSTTISRKNAVRLAIAALLACVAIIGSVAEPAGAAGSPTTPIWVGAPYRGAYAGTNGRPTSSLPGRHASVYTVPGYSYVHDWAMDFYAPAGTPVRLYAAPKNSALNSQITAKVLSVRATCASGRIADGGYVAFVGLYHSGTRVGSIAYAHVNPDFNGDGVTNSTDIGYRGSLNRWGGYIGRVGAYSPNTCWQVNSTSGHHVHLEFANVQNYSCYRNLAAGSVISQSEYMGYLGGAFATARNKPCPAGA
jgi:hypothetical protein